MKCNKLRAQNCSPITKFFKPSFNENNNGKQGRTAPIGKHQKKTVSKGTSSHLDATRSLYTGGDLPNSSELVFVNSDPEDSSDDGLDVPRILQSFNDPSSDKRKTRGHDKIMSPYSDSEPDTPVQKKKTKANFSLDSLLTERELLESNSQLANMEKELQEGILAGGVRGIAVDTDVRLSPDHKKALDKMKPVVEQIMDAHPGEAVFTTRCRKRLVPLPETLQTHKISSIDRAIATLPPEFLTEMLTEETMLQCSHGVSAPKAFMTWLFELISVHTNPEQAYKTFSCTDWVPDVETIIRVFVNLGANAKAICLPSGAPLPADINNTDQGSAVLDPGGPNTMGEFYNTDNLVVILNIIGDAAQRRSECYSAQDIVHIISIVLKASLDIQLRDSVLDDDFMNCLSCLLHSILEHDWLQQVTTLSRIIPTLTKHHHNLVHICTLLPPCERGRYLSQRVAYAMLHKLITGYEPHIENLTEFKVRLLQPLLSGIQLKDEDVDYYLLTSLISLVKLSVGNDTVPSREKEDLQALITIMQNKIGDIRELINFIDRSQLKNQMVRLASMWTFMVQNKEKAILTYVKVLQFPNQSK